MCRVEVAKAAVEEGTSDTVLVTIVTRCPLEKAIFNTVTMKFQSGDRVFMARVQAEQTKLRNLKINLRKFIDLSTQLGRTSTSAYIEGKKELEHLIAKQEFLVARIEAEDERRGRSRLFNHDECPQMICFGGGTGTTRRRVASAPGQPAKSGQIPNRESVSVHPMANLEGDFTPWHLLMAGESLSESMIDEAYANMPEGLVSHTANGVQTGKSLLNFYRKVVKWLETPRDTPNHEFGEWTIQLPIVTATDGHASRFDEAVLEFCANGDKIRQVLEPSQTSDKLQMFDQLFAAFHDRYSRGVREIRHYRGCTYQFTKHDLIQNIARIWPRQGPLWCGKSAVQGAFRVVGIQWNGFSVDFIPAGRLLPESDTESDTESDADMDRGEEEEAAEAMDEEAGGEAAAATAARRAKLLRRATLVGKPLVAPEPQGAGRKNSAEYWEAKYRWAEERIAGLAAELKAEKEKIITPEAAGICELPVALWHQKRGPSGRTSVNSIDGSLSAVDAARSKRERNQTDMNGAMQKAEKELALLGMWRDCRVSRCTCGGKDWYGKKCTAYKKCEFCGTISTRQCGKGDCKKKRAALVARGARAPAAALPPAASPSLASSVAQAPATDMDTDVTATAQEMVDAALPALDAAQDTAQP